ncbi:MAG TPA: hypothetical protein VMT64_05385 [Candidatus Binataceae bacterium]|nr:hypothetical protein [Candidatus Binataceae bacterium]
MHSMREMMFSSMRRALCWTLLGLVMVLAPAGCNNGFGAFQVGVGNTPNRPPLAAFRILGQYGMQFSAVVSDADVSWNVSGAVPMNIIVINNQTNPVCACSPVRVIATKQSAGNGILSIQLTVGFKVRSIASTSAPYGVATLQNNANSPGSKTPPPLVPAEDDVRLFIRGPITERFSGLFEDSQTAFILDDRAPALFLFDSPQGPVDASVTQIQNLGPLDIDLLLGGAVVAHAIGGPTVVIHQP